MKPKLKCPSATETSAPAACERLTSKHSFQNQSRQGAAVKIRPSVRVPVSPVNRAYLKALREAESAAWEQGTPSRARFTRVEPAAARLPVSARDSWDGWTSAFLALLAAATVGYELWSLFQAGANWHDFVQFVRQLTA
jgi:hypothetical protein